MTKKIKLKEENEQLQTQEVESLLLKDESKIKEDIEKLKQEIATAIYINAIGPNATACGGEELKQYENESKKLLRKIWQLSHDDTMEKSSLTESQKKKLRECFDKTMRIRHSEIGLDRRSVPELQNIINELSNILSEVELIRENEGVDVNVKMIIRGQTVQEQIEWLDQKILRLEKEQNQINADIHVLTNDIDILEKQASMSSEEQIADVLKQMEESAHKFEREYNILERRYEKLFKEKKQGNNGGKRDIEEKEFNHDNAK
ncbi:hypothetical protein MCHI_001184 [Candidatus Magnetoovum chiemensis]|nr:hypothetical protein MCHI_001184 [Candidatus Magnetoovum chiemensis]